MLPLVNSYGVAVAQWFGWQTYAQRARVQCLLVPIGQRKDQGSNPSSAMYVIGLISWAVMA